DFLTPHGAAHLRDIELPAVQNDGRWAGESQLRHCRSGRLVDVAVNSFVVRGAAADSPPCIATVQHDVTHLKRHEQSIEASEERFRQLAENIEEVFWVSQV